MSRLFFTGVLVLALLGVLAACSDDGGDNSSTQANASVGRVNNATREVITMPHGYSNVAHGCDGYGHRVFVTALSGGGNASGIFVLEDDAC